MNGHSTNHRKQHIKGINSQLRMMTSMDTRISYSQAIGLLGQANIVLNRKMLADLAVKEPQTFVAVVRILVR